MKRTLAFGFALSVLASSAAFAAPHAATEPAVAQNVIELPATHVTADAKRTPKVERDVSKQVMVAEVRREFGSQYQRY